MSLGDPASGGPGPPTWSATAAPLSMVVVCGGERHRLRWRDGVAEPVDHPELDAERVLVALGGEEPACLAMLRLWEDALADGGFLAEWVDETRLDRAWLSWLAMALERMRSEGFHEFLRHLPMARAQRMGEFLHRFPPPWVDRAGAAISGAVAAGERAGTDDGALAETALLRLAAANRLRRSFVEAVGGRQLSVGAAALVPLTPVVAPGGPVDDPERRAPDRTPRIEGALTGPGRGVSVLVGATWLHEVWAAGAAVIDGHLVLDLAPAPTPGSDHRALLVEWRGPGPLRPEPVWRPVRHVADEAGRDARSGWRLVD